MKTVTGTTESEISQTKHYQEIKLTIKTLHNHNSILVIQEYKRNAMVGISGSNNSEKFTNLISNGSYDKVRYVHT